MVAYPRTVSQFRKLAEDGFRRANRDADMVGLVIRWTFGPKRVTFPTGLEGFSGVFHACAPGYRAGEHVATATRETGISVR